MRSRRLLAVGLAERAEQRAARLSAGERQRVAIARAVAAGAGLLLADEPTARLDEANALAVGALFSRLAREAGVAVVVATHDPLVVEQADATLGWAATPVRLPRAASVPKVTNRHGIEAEGSFVSSRKALAPSTESISGSTGRDLRLPRPEWRRQVHDGAHARHAPASD